MVRFLKYTRAFFKLIRIQNIFIIALTMYLLRWFVIIPLLNNLYFEPQLSEFRFFILVLATVNIAAAGYVINDYFDRKADLINRPGTVILGRILSLRAGMFWHTVLNFFGIGLGVLLAYKLGNIRLSVIFVAVSGLLWFYSTTYKRQVLIGNLLVALMVASVPLTILLFELPLILEKYQYYIDSVPDDVGLMVAWILGYSLFAFLLTLVREIIKDLEDFEGDAAFGRNTIPIAWGPVIAKQIIYFILLGSLFFLCVALYKYRWSTLTIIYGLILIVIPLLIVGYIIFKAGSKKEYHRASILVKLIMLTGLFFNVIAYYIIF